MNRISWATERSDLGPGRLHEWKEADDAEAIEVDVVVDFWRVVAA